MRKDNLMIKECTVLLNNSAVTVVKFGEVEVQLPSIQRDAKKVFVKFENDRYTVVDKLDEPEVQTKKKSKKTIVENDIGDNEPIVEDK